MSPTARSLAYLRRLGYMAAPVEKWIERVRKKRDLFGIADVLAVHPKDQVFLLVQATSIGHVGDRLKRCQARPELAVWLQAGGRFEVHGWTAKNGRPEVKRVAVVVLMIPRRGEVPGAERVTYRCHYQIYRVAIMLNRLEEALQAVYVAQTKACLRRLADVANCPDCPGPDLAALLAYQLYEVVIDWRKFGTDEPWHRPPPGLSCWHRQLWKAALNFARLAGCCRPLRESELRRLRKAAAVIGAHGIAA